MRGVVTTVSAVLWLWVSAGSVGRRRLPARRRRVCGSPPGHRLRGGRRFDELIQATGAVPQADGEAKVEARPGITNIEVKVKGLVQPTSWVLSS
jgi:hypothetical protein